MQAEYTNPKLQSFISLIDDIDDAVCIISAEGKPEFVNSSFKTLSGFGSKEEINLNGGLAGLITANVCSSIFSHISKKNRWQENIFFKTKNSESISLELKVKPLTESNGEIIGAAIYFRNGSIEKHPEDYLRLLESFVENANDAVMITEAQPIDEPGPRIVYVNPAFTRITGYSKGEILGKSPRLLQGPATSRTELDKVRHALETQSHSKIEIINYTKAGKAFWMEFSVVPVPDHNKKVTHYVSIQRETTQKKHTSQALLQKNEELQKALQINKGIFEHSLDIICVFDEEAKFIRVSQACERIWGYPPKELIGQSLGMLVYPGDIEKTIAMSAKFMAEGIMSDFEHRIVHKDGRLIPMLWTGSWSEGNKCMYTIGRDTSEKKAAEDRIRQSEQLYRSLSQNYPNGTISILDKDFRILVMEGLELARFNVTSEMLAGRHIHEIFGLRAVEYIQERLSPSFEGHTLSQEMHIDNMYYLCTTVPLPENGEINHILVVTQDISDRKKAEKRLEESYQIQQRLAARMSAIMDALPAQVALVNTEGIIIEVNEAWKSFALQYKFPNPNYGIGYNYIHVCDTANGEFSEGAAGVSAGIQEVIYGKAKSFSQEYPCNTPTEEKWFKLAVSPMTDTYPTDVVVMHVDITDRKHIEQKLQESEQQYKSLFEYHPDAVCALDLEGNFISANPAMAKLAGIPVEELINTSFIPLIAPQDRKQVIDYFKKTCEGHPQDFEISLTMPDGSLLIAHIINIPIIISHEITGVYSILKNITPTKKAQKLVEETIDRLNNILESIGDGFFTLDMNFTVTYWNKAAEKITGTKKENVLNKNFWEVFPEAAKLKYYNEYRRAMYENISVHFEECYIPSQTWTEVNAYPSENSLTVYFRDITERKKAEENLQNSNLQLQKSNHELDQFVYRASHDLRAPLVSVLGLISLSHMETEEAQRNYYLTLMEKSVRKLDTFIQDIIYYSKNSRTELILSEVNFGLLIANTIDDLKYMEEAKTIEFRTDIEQMDGFYTDESRLNVILHNMVANAIRYHDASKKQYISICVTNIANRQIRIVVEDNGQGIDKEHQERVFEMFYRATEKNVGSGLGLYIVKENLKKLKGTIALNSEPGKGTTFTIAIPNLSDQANLIS